MAEVCAGEFRNSGYGSRRGGTSRVGGLARVSELFFDCASGWRHCRANLRGGATKSYVTPILEEAPLSRQSSGRKFLDEAPWPTPGSTAPEFVTYPPDSFRRFFLRAILAKRLANFGPGRSPVLTALVRRIKAIEIRLPCVLAALRISCQGALAALRIGGDAHWRD